MAFDELLVQVIELLQREKRVSYRALKRRFDLNDEYLEDIKMEKKTWFSFWTKRPFANACKCRR